MFPELHPTCGACGRCRLREARLPYGTLDGPMWWACAAYPKGIPANEAFWKALTVTGHTSPLPGDHGVMFLAGKPRLPWDEDEEGAP